MDKRQLKKLKRSELLELLLDQMEMNERLRSDVERLAVDVNRQQSRIQSAVVRTQDALRLIAIFQDANRAVADLLQQVEQRYQSIQNEPTVPSTPQTFVQPDAPSTVHSTIQTVPQTFVETDPLPTVQPKAQTASQTIVQQTSQPIANEPASATLTRPREETNNTAPTGATKQQELNRAIADLVQRVNAN